MAQQLTSIECPTCFTTYSGVPLEDGLAAIEARPCADCGKLLCPHCASAKCDGCDGLYCREHMISIPDGTARPLLCCAACAEACEEPAPRCPHCARDRVVVDTFHFGVDSQTGYRDDGELYVCQACGQVGEPEELVYLPEPAIELVERKAPAIAARVAERKSA